MHGVRLDNLGRIVIPKSIRDRLGLEPGDLFEVGVSNGNIKFKPIHLSSRIKNHIKECRSMVELMSTSTKAKVELIEKLNLVEATFDELSE